MDEERARHRASGLSLTCALVAAALAVTAGSGTARAEIMQLRDCDEIMAYVPGDEAQLKASIPARHELVRDPIGRPLLLVWTGRCREAAIEGKTFPVDAYGVGAVVASPDGTGCVTPWTELFPMPGDLLPYCNWYVLSQGTTSPAFAEWVREDSDYPISVVSGLSYRSSQPDVGRLGTPVRFDAPPPALATFRIDALARAIPRELPFSFNWWRDTSKGVVKISAAATTRFGQADGTVSAPPGSELTRLMGAERQDFIPGFSLFAANHFDFALVYRETQR